jgi:hypothetical protein
VKFRENLSRFFDAGSNSIIRPNGDVQAINIRLFGLQAEKSSQRRLLAPN